MYKVILYCCYYSKIEIQETRKHKNKEASSVCVSRCFIFGGERKQKQTQTQTQKQKKKKKRIKEEKQKQPANVNAVFVFVIFADSLLLFSFCLHSFS